MAEVACDQQRSGNWKIRGTHACVTYRHHVVVFHQEFQQPTNWGQSNLCDDDHHGRHHRGKEGICCLGGVVDNGGIGDYVQL